MTDTDETVLPIADSLMIRVLVVLCQLQLRGLVTVKLWAVGAGLTPCRAKAAPHLALSVRLWPGTRPPLHHVERGRRAWNRPYRIALDCGLRRNDGRLGAIHRAPTQKTYPGQVSQGESLSGKLSG